MNQHEQAQLRAFARTVIRQAWEGTIDCADIQEIAIQHGLLEPEIYDPDRHGEHVEAEPGETVFVFTTWLAEIP